VSRKSVDFADEFTSLVRQRRKNNIYQNPVDLLPGAAMENFLVGHIGGFLQANWLFPLLFTHD
jgi:hypothetical protein